MDVMSDGVMLGKGNVEIKSRPKALWVITPEDGSAPTIQEKEEELPPSVSPVLETDASR
jgi:hypothetical protein